MYVESYYQSLSPHPFLSLLFFCFVCPLINKFKLSLAFQCRSKTNRKSDKKAKPKQNLDPSLFTTHHGDQPVPSPYPSLPSSRSQVKGMNKFSLIMLAQPSRNVHTCDDRPYSLLSFKYLYMTSDYIDTHTERERNILVYKETLSHNSKLSATMFAYRLRTGSGFLLSRRGIFMEPVRGQEEGSTGRYEVGTGCYLKTLTNNFR